MTTQLPSEAYQLGIPTAEYRAQKSIFVACGGVGLLLLGFAGVAFSQFGGWDMSELGADAASVGLGLLMLGAAAGILALIFYQLRHQVLLCPEGVIDIRGSEVNPCPWDQIEMVLEKHVRVRVNGVTTGTQHGYMVWLRDGKKLHIGALQNVQQLGAAIQEEVTQRRWPQTVAAYNKGDTVSFGKLGVSRQGLSLNHGKKLIPWSDLQDLRLFNGLLRAKVQGKWINAAMFAEIPNYYLFAGILAQVMPSKQSA